MATTPVIFNVGTAVAPEQHAYKTLTGVVPEYQVMLDVRGDESVDRSGKKIFPIVANLPERFNMELSSQWDTPFARTSVGDVASAMSGGKVSADVINTGLGATGVGKTSKPQTAQVWQESSPMGFNLEMIFRAVTNSEIDVRQKHIALLKLVAPSEFGGVLIAPGPNIRDKMIDASNSRLITLHIGRYIKLQNVVIRSVSSDVTALFDKHGIPQAMSISVAVESFYSCFTTQDIDLMFTV